MSSRAIVFGAGGALGSTICQHLESSHVEVLRASRKESRGTGWLSLATPDWPNEIEPRSVNQVIWAQGLNAEGSILNSGVDQLESLFEANVLFIAQTLRALIDRNVFEQPARLVIVSSVWQQTARNEKLAYVTTKAALSGLVRSLVIDLGPLNISVNAVLPGVVETPMSRKFLTAEQIRDLEGSTPNGQLVSPDEVAHVCTWLSSPMSSGVNGQFITVDGGWNEVRYV